MNTIRRNFCLILLFLLSVVCFVVCGVFTFTANAEQINTSLFLPQSKLDVLDLNTSAPAHATVYDGGSAIITENKKLYIFNNGEYVEYTLLNSNNPGQIRYFGENYLLVNDNLQLYTIDLNDLTKSPQPFTYNGEQITSSYFEINGNYLATISNNKIFVYQLNGITAITKSELPVNPKLPSPVCISQDGKVFFIRLSDTKLCVYDESQLNGTPILTSGDGISNMVSYNGILYYTLNNSVYSINENVVETDNVLPTQLQCSDEFNAYDLGSIQNPTDMHFYDDNLVITDSQKYAVQQFKIDDNQLVFTGKAIAKNKTAYNRISSNASKINMTRENIAVLDEFKLTILPNDKNFNRYDKTSYKNFFVSELGDPITFALGNKSVLLGFNEGVKKIDLANGQKDEQLTSVPNLKSIIYTNDRYYILTNDGTVSKVFTTDENITQINEICTEQITASVFTVDVFGNVYLYNQTEVYKNGEELCSEIGITQLLTDLNGNLYSVKDTKVRYFDNTQTVWTDFISLDQNVISVANTVFTDDLYVLQENSEFIYIFNPDGYACISDINLAEDFKLTDKTVLNQLKVYTVNQGTYAYCIDTVDGVKYKNHVQPESEYAFICKTNIDGVNGQVEYLLLAGEKGATLTHSSSANEKIVNYNTQVSDKIYVATDVNVYFFPIITKNNAYVLNDGETTTRLKKGAVFSPISKFTFGGIEYYYANVSTTENAVYGYVPLNFTVEILAENVSYSIFTVEKITQTTLYLDKDLTQAVLDIQDGQSVRIYQNDNGVLRVWYQTENGFIEGYITASAIIDNPDLQVRNILLVLAVSACLCGSVTYFVLRNKRD